VQARLQPTWPISAVTAEVLALDLAARALAAPYAENPTAPAMEVCIDCQVVVQALSNLTQMPATIAPSLPET
jgi:hypothetical protein